MTRGPLTIENGDAFARALREAVQRRGLGLQRLSSRLAERGVTISAATLSYWQSGRSRPERAESLRALAALEDILGLAPDALREQLPPPRPRGRGASVVVDRLTLLPHGEQIRDLMTEIKLEESSLVRLSQHDVHVLDPDRQTRAQTVRQLHRAEVDGARTWSVLHTLDPAPADPILLTDLVGCSSLLEREAIGHGVLGARLTLPRALGRGDTALTEYTVRFPANGLPSDQVERALPGRMRELVIEVRFAPEDVPSTCRGYTVVDGEERWWPVPLDGHPTAHLMLRDFGPGTCGLLWEW